MAAIVVHVTPATFTSLDLFFFSGHGGHSTVGDYPGELDDRNELLFVLGETENTYSTVSDDQLNERFDELPASALKMIVLDTCYSSGFARDVISARNRVGFFSSEEDVSSNTAEELQAGGYLSLIFREAIEGRGDLNKDASITIGEIKDFIVVEFPKANKYPSDTTSGLKTRQMIGTIGASSRRTRCSSARTPRTTSTSGRIRSRGVRRAETVAAPAEHGCHG